MAGGLEVADVFRRHGPAFRARTASTSTATSAG